MIINYDDKVDAAYIRFLEGDFECTTIRLSEDIAVNMSPDGRVVGIEVLVASENLQIFKKDPTVLLNNIKAQVA